MHSQTSRIVANDSPPPVKEDMFAIIPALLAFVPQEGQVPRCSRAVLSLSPAHDQPVAILIKNSTDWKQLSLYNEVPKWDPVLWCSLACCYCQ